MNTIRKLFNLLQAAKGFLNYQSPATFDALESSCKACTLSDEELLNMYLDDDEDIFGSLDDFIRGMRK